MYAKDGTIRDKREMLRVKLKSLAQEAKIIRYEEMRSAGPLREQLYLHRVGAVRAESRDTHIAYGLIRGRQYEKIEQHVSNARGVPGPRWKNIRTMIQRYGPKDFVEPECMKEKTLDGTAKE